ncbi:hypothetical protein HY488_02375, partial [Candidatus Woesearchaeota archaeon]|nr:hypothetical protein [Candidatus Woesearchaeota archaeon]
FYFFIIVFATLAGKFGKVWSEAMVLGIGGLDYTNPAKQAAMKWLAVKLLLFVLLFFLALLIVWLVSRGLIWALLSGKKYTWNFAWRFSVANAIWLLILAVPVIYLFIGLYQSVKLGPTPATQVYYWYHVLFFLVVLYTSYLLNHLFTRYERVFVTLKETTKQVVLGFPKIIIPFLFMTATLVLLGWASKLLNYTPKLFSNIVGGVLFFASFTWAKMYYHAALSAKLGAKEKAKAALVKGVHKVRIPAKKKAKAK